MTDNATQAKRGDLVVIHVRSTSYALHGPASEHDEFTVGTVTSVTRDGGQVKRYRPAGSFERTDYLGRPYRGQEMPRTGFIKCYVMPAAQIDLAGAMATAACHVWQGHETTRAYDSLDEVRAALRPHAHRSAGWEALHSAAVTWETARRAADEAYHTASVAANRAHAQAGYHTRAGDELRRQLDREAMDAHSAAVTAANEAYRAASSAHGGTARAA